jgi:hypothetical protein
MHSFSPLFHRFLRDNPEEMLGYRIQLMGMIVDWAKQFKPVSCYYLDSVPVDCF